MDKLIAGKTIQVNEEGFMTNFSEWNKEVGEALAVENKIELSPKHWELINYIQSEVKNEAALSIRKIGKSGIVDIKEFYALFPNAPLKTATKIAGVPKPAGCI
ncbi:MAG: TusE/DsrC/DsvC family sulfur relay protein [Bacteroidetes bacterium]|nr:TusE/DsrC/DsvC family sulfur relay protein [Bacteroidota bacterium]